MRMQLKGNYTDKNDINENQDDHDEMKQSDSNARDRRQQYRHQPSYGNPEHWTDGQKSYFEQCSNSFSSLKGLCFFDDYWQGYLVCYLFRCTV